MTKLPLGPPSPSERICPAALKVAGQGQSSSPAPHTQPQRDVLSLTVSGSCVPCLHHLPFPSPGLKQGKFVLTFLETRCPGEGSIELGPPESGRGSSWLALPRPLLGPHGIHWRCARVQISLPFFILFPLCVCACMYNAHVYACLHVCEPHKPETLPYPSMCRWACTPEFYALPTSSQTWLVLCHIGGYF